MLQLLWNFECYLKYTTFSELINFALILFFFHSVIPILSEIIVAR